MYCHLSHVRQLLRRSLSLLLCSVLIWLLSQPVALFAQQIKPQHLHVQRIHELAAKSKHTPAESYELAVHHLELGELYAKGAWLGHLLMVNAAICFGGSSPLSDYGATVSAHALGMHPQAHTFARRARQSKVLPPVLQNSAAALGDGAALDPIGWPKLSKNSSGRIDSLDYFCRMQLATAGGNCNFLSNFSWENNAVEVPPVLLRARIAQLLCQSNRDELERLIDSVDQTEPPFIRVPRKGENDLTLSDPTLLELLSRAHYTFARLHFDILLKDGSDPSTGKQAAEKWVKAAMGSDFSPTRGIDQIPNPLRKSAYAALLQARDGNRPAAEKSLEKLLSDKDITVRFLVLELAAQDSSLTSLGNKAAAIFRARVEELSSQKELAGNARANQERGAYSLSLGRWYQGQQKADSASLYFGISRTMPEVSLAFASANYCLSYFASRIFDGRLDFRQEGYQGLVTLTSSFPALRLALEPLAQTMLCDSKKRLTE